MTRSNSTIDFFDDGDESNLEMMADYIDENKYVLVFNMPEKIKSTTKPNAKLSSDKKSVTTSFKLLDLMQGNADLNISINTK